MFFFSLCCVQRYSRFHLSEYLIWGNRTPASLIYACCPFTTLDNLCFFSASRTHLPTELGLPRPRFYGLCPHTGESHLHHLFSPVSVCLDTMLNVRELCLQSRGGPSLSLHPNTCQTTQGGEKSHAGEQVGSRRESQVGAALSRRRRWAISTSCLGHGAGPVIGAHSKGRKGPDRAEATLRQGGMGFLRLLTSDTVSVRREPTQPMHRPPPGFSEASSNHHPKAKSFLP